MRQRQTGGNSDDESFILGTQSPSSAQTLLDMKPSYSGSVMKQSNALIVWLLPCFFDIWQPRFLILAGGYLFRFKCTSSQSTKGSPIPLASSTVEVSRDDVTAFEMKSLRKTYSFKCVDARTCLSWVRAIRLRKSEAVREDMGHVRPSACSVHANRYGRAKEEVRDREEEAGSATELLTTMDNPMVRMAY